ncbi:TonB-dependent receptor [Pseudoduganella sp. RAF19]|uniref:TonB-dependent receptor n=2 Tax=unclassified Pseudoduganella TaxID=2637179 RepID=UPI003F957101
MKVHPIAAAVSLALLSISHTAYAADPQPAQDSAAQANDPNMQVVDVTGIRASKQKSLDRKKNASINLEAVSAEDIGKMPDKNIADAVQRLPGVNVGATSAGQFDEAERVSLRGSSPNLTLTLVNGHSVSSGDWHVADQTSSGRSVGFALLPSELVSQVLVYKTAQADIVDGGLAGTVDIITRKPLDFKQPLTLEASIGGVYADLPGKTSPQFSALANWKNADNTLGVMVQAFSEERQLRRDSQEHLWWTAISPTSAAAKAHPELANARYSGLIGSALFEGERKRQGGMLALEAKPNRDLTVGFTGMYSKLDAQNYNRNHMQYSRAMLGTGDGVQNFQYTLNPAGNVITGLNIPNPGPGYAAETTESYVRNGAKSDSTFLDLNAKYRVNERLEIKAQLGYTKGEGKTPKQSSVEVMTYNSGLAYTLHGIDSAADVSYSSLDPSKLDANTKLSGAGGTNITSSDDERNGQLDAILSTDWGPVNKLKFGVRASNHGRELAQVSPGLNAGVTSLPAWNGDTYPGDFGQGLGGNFPTNVWYIDPKTLEQWKDSNVDADPIRRELLRSEFNLKEKINAAYVMAEAEQGAWSGNVGVRAVQTKDDVLLYVPVAATQCAPLAPCSVPGAINTSIYGTYYQQQVSNKHFNLLPSLNVRYEFNHDLIGRVGLNRTISRPNYADIAGGISSVDNLTHKATGGNPNLKPIKGDNFDASLGWYFAPRALLSAGVFASNIHDYVKFGESDIQLYNTSTGALETYRLTSPGAISAKLRGVELAWEQPIGAGFGFNANYTYADSKDAEGARMLGQSKHTYNIGAYYENDKWSARLAYNGRSDYIIAIDRVGPTIHADDFATLAGSIQYKINEHLSLSFDGLNLNDPISKNYVRSKDEPHSFRRNGRQYFLNLRVKY